MISSQPLLASQPIYTQRKTVYSCELFFPRTDKDVVKQIVSGQKEISELWVTILGGLTDIRELTVTPVFINISEETLYDDPWLMVDPGKTVLVLSAFSNGPDELSVSIRKWRNSGYQFALDGYNFDTSWHPLMHEFSYLSVDMERLPVHQIIENYFAYRTPGNSAKWIATRVASEAVFETCVELGFDLFQGCFLAVPKTVTGRIVRPEQTRTVELLRAITDPDMEMSRIANIVATDPKLTFQILKVVNSPLYHLPKTIESIQQAIVMLGLDALKRWVYLLSMVSTARCDQESCRLILVRARTCELECTKSMPGSAQGAFLMGVLSGADLMLEISRAELFKHISVTEEIKEAVLSNRGRLGRILASVTQFEHSVLHSRDAMREPVSQVAHTYAEASIWVNELLSSIRLTA